MAFIHHPLERLLSELFVVSASKGFGEEVEQLILVPLEIRRIEARLLQALAEDRENGSK